MKLAKDDNEKFQQIKDILYTPVVGDLVFGDLDGVVIIPQKHEDEVLERSEFQLRRKESETTSATLTIHCQRIFGRN